MNPEYGRPGARILAFVLDFIAIRVLLIVFALVVGGILGLVGLSTTVSDSTAAIAGIALYGGTAWLYFAIGESSASGMTWGKKMAKIRVQRSDGARLTFIQASIRFWCKLLSIGLLGIGLLIALKSPMKQTLHDRIAGTVVVTVQ